MLSSVWLISLRDLQWRRRRFIIAVVSAALAFALTLLLEGTVAHMRSEGPRVVNLFGADGWVVADGASGPFTTAQLLPAAATGAIAAIPGVTAASPLLVGRATVKDVDVNLVGYERGGVTEPPKVRSGRLPDRSGEALVDSSLGLRPGEHVTILGRSFPIVGTTSGTTFYFGQATVFLPIEDVQQTLLAGQPLASAIVVRGRPGALPAGLTLMTDAQVTKDLARPLGQSAQTLTMINGLLWLTAAGVIGSIIYMTALERQRDVAVLKATGASTRSLLGGLAFEALVLAVHRRRHRQRAGPAARAAVSLPRRDPRQGVRQARRGGRRRRPDRQRRGRPADLPRRPGPGVRRCVMSALAAPLTTVSVAVRDLGVEYSSGGYRVRPIDHLDLDIAEGELVLALGASGCGKTTLLSALASILTPTSGSIVLRHGDQTTEVTALRGPS